MKKKSDFAQLKCMKRCARRVYEKVREKVHEKVHENCMKKIPGFFNRIYLVLIRRKIHTGSMQNPFTRKIIKKTEFIHLFIQNLNPKLKYNNPEFIQDSLRAIARARKVGQAIKAGMGWWGHAVAYRIFRNGIVNSNSSKMVSRST